MIFVEKTSADFLLVSMPKDITLPYFAEKTFVNSYKNLEIRKFYSLKLSPYMVLHKASAFGD